MPYLAAANLLLLEVNFYRKAADKQDLQVLINASLQGTKAWITNMFSGYTCAQGFVGRLVH